MNYNCLSLTVQLDEFRRDNDNNNNNNTNDRHY